MTNDIYIQQQDAVDWLHMQPNQSINLIVTDPAYASLEKHRAKGTTTRLKNSDASSNAWFEIFPNERYFDFFIEAYRALDNNSHMYVMCDQETGLLIKPIAEKVGFTFWKFITWNKLSMGMGYHYRNQTEWIMFLEKGKRNLNNLGMCDVLEHKRVRNGYPTEKPIGLYTDLIEQSSEKGEVVADPFFGSGNGLIAANMLGRQAIGTDISTTAIYHLLNSCNARGITLNLDNKKQEQVA
jgi:site-specific DNA-methyltransferase (adenine-specific)